VVNRKSELTNISVTERVELLERQLRFWRVMVLLVAGSCFGVLAGRLSAAPERLTARIVSAQQFDVLNASGRVVVRMNQDPGDPTGVAGGMVFMYPNQKAAISIGLNEKYGPSVSLLDTDGRIRAHMVFASDGPAVELDDDAHRPIIAMEVRTQGPRFKVFDKSLTKYVWVAP
jgi:hypothetical protein